jgi:hypothetical protein
MIDDIYYNIKDAEERDLGAEYIATRLEDLIDSDGSLKISKLDILGMIDHVFGVSENYPDEYMDTNFRNIYRLVLRKFKENNGFNITLASKMINPIDKPSDMDTLLSDINMNEDDEDINEDDDKSSILDDYTVLYYDNYKNIQLNMLSEESTANVVIDTENNLPSDTKGLEASSDKSSILVYLGPTIDNKIAVTLSSDDDSEHIFVKYFDNTEEAEYKALNLFAKIINNVDNSLSNDNMSDDEIVNKCRNMCQLQMEDSIA